VTLAFAADRHAAAAPGGCRYQSILRVRRAHSSKPAAALCGGRMMRQETGRHIGADFRFEVPGQSSVELIGGGRGQWLGGTTASAEHKPIMGVWKPP